MNLRHMRILCILLYWLNISMWNDKNAVLPLFLSFVVSLTQRKVKSVIGIFYLREKEKVVELQFAIFIFLVVKRAGHADDLTEDCGEKTPQSSHRTSCITVAWKLYELNYHNIYFLAKLMGAGKNIFIFAGYVLLLASLCNYTIVCLLLSGGNNYLQK